MLGRVKTSAFATCLFVITVALCTTTFAQEKSEHKSLVPEHGTRITGSVDIIMDGKSLLKSPSEILAIAKTTKFNEAGGYESKHDGGSIQYVPPEITPDDIGKALVEGLLLYKFTIKGTPPKYIKLTAGTYYFYMQYLDGKWIGVAVDQEGKAGCLSIGLIARQIITIHPGKEHQKDFRIVVHPIAPANDLATLGFQAKDDVPWVETTATWKPIGHGPACITTTVCVPQT